MSKKEKAIARLLSVPSDYTYDEAKTLLLMLGFKECNQGRTSGSRVRFINSYSIQIVLHKPHPSSEFKKYAVRDIIRILDNGGLI